MLPLVLVHGTRMDAAQWDPYRELLPGVEVTAVDLPGHGTLAGDDFTGEAALAGIGDAVAEATARTGQRPVLAGHSLGGYLAMMWAARHPGELSRLVLIGATGDPAARLAGVYRGFASVTARVDPDRLAARMNALMRVLGARGRQAAALPGGAGYAALPAAWQYVMAEAGPALLAEVDCPVVLVNGQLDQMRLHVRRFAAAARQVEVITIPRATHLLPMTHSRALAAVLRRAVATDTG